LCNELWKYIGQHDKTFFQQNLFFLFDSVLKIYMIWKKFAAGKIARMTCQCNLLRDIRHLDRLKTSRVKKVCQQRNSEKKCAGA